MAALHWGQSRVLAGEQFDRWTKTKKTTNPEKEALLRLFRKLVLPGCQRWPGHCSLQSCPKSPCGADSPKVTTNSRCDGCAVTAWDLLAEIPGQRVNVIKNKISKRKKRNPKISSPSTSQHPFLNSRCLWQILVSSAHALPSAGAAGAIPQLFTSRSKVWAPTSLTSEIMVNIKKGPHKYSK